MTKNKKKVKFVDVCDSGYAVKTIDFDRFKETVYSRDANDYDRNQIED